MSGEDQVYARYLEGLRSHSFREVLGALVGIRTLLQNKSPVKIAHKLRSTGILKILVKIIHKKYSKILSLALSILSTCALELETRIMLLRLGLPALLVKIMKETENDSILGRVCRFIGNLGALPAASIEFHACGAVAELLKLIEIGDHNKSSTDTKQMAIRALRVLGDTRENRAELLKQEVVKHIAAHLAQEDQALVKCTLKTLNSFSTAVDGALQIMSSSSAQGFETLVKLAKDERSSELAITCICNLTTVEAVRPDLGKVGAITIIFDELKKTNSKCDSRALITTLDRFCCECVNRIRIKDNDHIGDLLDLLRSSRYCHLHDIVIRALGRFHYDEKNLTLFVQKGLVKVLVNKVRQYVRTLLPIGHAFQPFRIDYSCMDSDSDIESFISSQRSHRGSPAASPASPASLASQSPQRSPLSLADCRSPAYSITSSSAADNYSPVYDESSDDEDDDCLALIGEEDDDICSILANRNETDKRQRYVTSIFRMLQRISTFDWAISEMMVPAVINTLVAAIISGDMYQEASCTLSNVMSKHEFLLPLIRHRYAMLVYNKLGVWRHAGNCNICRKREKYAKSIFSNMIHMTDSVCARGELSYVLQKGTEKDKICAALAIPYMVRTVSNFRELLLGKEQKGLALLLNLVEDPVECSAAVQSLYVLSKCVDISYTEAIESETPLFDSYTPSDEPPSEIIKFLLDDGSIITADKAALSGASEFFSSMLFGDFMESKQEVVSLKEVSKSSLVLLLLFCRSYVGDLVVTVGKPEVVAVLDLLLLSDRYLIFELKEKLREYVKANYFDSENLANVFRWCHEKMKLECGDDVLSIYDDACAFLLCSRISQNQRLHIFKSVLNQPEAWSRLKDCIACKLELKLQTGFRHDTVLNFRFNYTLFEQNEYQFLC